MKTRDSRLRLVILLATLFVLIFSIPAMATVRASFLYFLSDFTGTISYNWARVCVDNGRNEIYVLYQNTLRIFNESGMEIHRFGDDLNLGQIIDIAVDPSGDILLLTYEESGAEIIRCNYRGEPKSKIELKNLPPDFIRFSPTRMVYQDESLYLISNSQMKIIVTDSEGNFKRGHDILSLVELDEKDRADTGITGFGVDREGNVLFTINALFKAYILFPDGKMASFGTPGSGPGKFNVVSGITKDGRGNYLIVDKLKCAVMVFDKKFKFVTQFGYRGPKPGGLIAPDEIVIDNSDRVYVTQAARKGVSVFKLTYN